MAGERAYSASEVNIRSNSTPMVEAVPQAEAFPTGENDRTRKCFGLCELYGAQQCRDGVNKNPAKSLGEKELAPRHGFEPRFS